MKTLLLLFIATISLVGKAQTPSEQMEKRAREMHRVMLLPDKNAWRKFIKENYTQTLIDKPMRQNVETSEDTGSGASTKTQTSTAENLEAKVNMYATLHQHFKNSKISSIKSIADGLEMTTESPGGIVGVFTLRFEKTSNLIDGIGIQVEAR